MPVADLPWDAGPPSLAGEPSFLPLGRRVGDLGWRRSRQASGSLVLAHAVAATTAIGAGADVQRLAIAGTLAALTASSEAFELWHGDEPVWLLLDRMASFGSTLGSDATARSRFRAAAVLEQLGEHRAAKEVREVDVASGPFLYGALAQALGGRFEKGGMLVLHLLSPDPLELLVCQALGLPSFMSLEGPS